ncbi:MAG: diguanylate cyclase, partial [Rhodocyclaceae bacterium]
MKSSRLHVRIALSFALLLLVVLAAILAIVNGILSGSTEKDIEQSLASGERVFGLLIEDNKRQLLQSANILSADFAFREAIATSDRATVLSVLANHGARINADVAMLVGIDGRLAADTLRPALTGQAFVYPSLIRVAQQYRQAAAMVLMDGGLYQLVVVPVLAPLPVAWLVLGFRIDNQLAGKLQSLTALEMSFAAQEKANGPWRVLATTLAANQAADLPAALATLDRTRAGGTALTAGEEPYLARVVFLDAQAPQEIVAVLQRSIYRALQALHRLQLVLIVLGVASLLASMYASLVLARGITRPIGALARLAGRVELGDLSQEAPVERADEVGKLAQAFNHMRAGISAREAKISELAFRDQLTALPNRQLFNDRLAQAIRVAKREGQSFSVLLLDLDQFKEVNDILGHNVGDLLLQEVGRRLQTTLMRDSDTVARLGGDEFAALLTGTDAAGAQFIAQRVLDVLNEPTILENQKVVASGSIGLAAYPLHGDETGTLLRHAELAMYVAKRNRSGFAVFDENLEQQSQEHLSLMAELRHALAHNELVLYYQPKVGMADRSLSQVEALVRWRHPERGLVPPGEFIPFAENTGFVREITRWAIEAALQQRQQWRDAGLALTISVNVSARDLIQMDLPDMIAELLKRYGAAPHWLALEITESAIMGDPQRALSVVE